MAPHDPSIDQLSAFVAGLRFEDLPAAVVARAKVHLLDTLGAALAGTRSAEAALARAVAARDAGGSARVWGTPDRASPREAALVNGVAAHAFELDDCGGCDHSGAVVVPALLAALPALPAPAAGRDLIVALVAGYEVGRRVLEAAGGYDAHNGRGWHSTGTCGPLAAAAAVARLRGSDAGTTRNAITLATSLSSGLWAFIHDGSPAKKLHAGRAAEGGLLAADLSGAGMPGPSRAFDEVWGGFFRAFNGEAGQPARLADGLGRDWMIERASLKPYASCRGAHSAVDAVGDILAEAGRGAAEIDTIDVRLSALLMDMCGGTAVDPLPAAQMSLPYALAALCAFGDAGLAAYAADRRRSPEIAAVMDRIRLAVDPGQKPLDPPVVTVLFRDGRRHALRVPRATGSRERPMSAAAVAAKFEALAGLALAPAAVAALAETVEALDAGAAVAGLDGLLAGTGPALPPFR